MSTNRSLTKTTKAIRAKVLASQASGQRHYSKALRAEVMRCVSRLRDEGATWAACSAALAVHKGTLYGWHKPATASAGALVPVKIRPEAQVVRRRELTLRTPSGVELSGLTLEQAAQLLKVLG